MTSASRGGQDNDDDTCSYTIIEDREAIPLLSLSEPEADILITRLSQNYTPQSSITTQQLQTSLSSNGSNSLSLGSSGSNNNNNNRKDGPQYYNANLVSSYTSDDSTLATSSNHTTLYTPPPRLIPSLPFTFHRALTVVILVVIYVALITTYFVVYPLIDQSNFALNLFLIIRPVPALALIGIIPLYGINDTKTWRYSMFIALGLMTSIVADIFFSVDVHLLSSTSSLHAALVVYYMMLTFTLVSRVLYTVAFVLGIGKNIRKRLPYAVPIYCFCATMVLMIVFSKQIAPVLIRWHNPIPNTDNDSISSSFDQSAIDPTSLALVIIYGIVEATLLWRAVALTSSFPGSNPTKILLWLSVLGSTVFCIADTLTVVSLYYYPLDGIFYLSTGGYWLGHILIVFSIPRRMEVRDYLAKYFKVLKEKTGKLGLPSFEALGSNSRDNRGVE
ncbi:hypothetical protein SAMD00019534_028100 [Acytostelium subglobosum LB1]|uniref:hypothetical protein n=1 Tax=Acytostelium subglobosum LB1 TaxID=1410327 RepID=UPI0006449D6A|nr:hypothetical protein SAMD00019534_028100 [Acytostelium subglobosum LB1]GAM19635.1 hypothetical protein SAMD00019534_028100 [Acytostelium subglobosum LB1]|eukprot:XP_012756397.1 hypothetical protein SAMD00019534_028100 [Acytostelium subglobosum LB1]